MNAETFIFFGIVGSGKGTQAKLLQDFLNAQDGKEMVYISSGNEYRKIIESGTQTASLVKTTLNEGRLLPDFLTNSMFIHILINTLSPEKHLIADGYPRTIGQSQCFEGAMQFYGREKVKIIYIELGETEAIKRMKLRGRSDDTDEGIAKRFQEYIHNVIPAMDYFKGKAGYETFTINGEQSIEDVHKDIIEKISKL